MPIEQKQTSDNTKETVSIKPENKEKINQKSPVVSLESGAATAALVIGIVGFVLCWFPIVDLILGILAIVLGSNGQKDQNGNVSTNKGQGIAGIVLGAFTTLIGLIFTLAILSNL